MHIYALTNTCQQQYSHTHPHKIHILQQKKSTYHLRQKQTSNQRTDRHTHILNMITSTHTPTHTHMWRHTQAGNQICSLWYSPAHTLTHVDKKRTFSNTFPSFQILLTVFAVKKALLVCDCSNERTFWTKKEKSRHRWKLWRGWKKPFSWKWGKNLNDLSQTY